MLVTDRWAREAERCYSLARYRKSLLTAVLYYVPVKQIQL